MKYNNNTVTSIFFDGQEVTELYVDGKIGFPTSGQGGQYIPQGASGSGQYHSHTLTVPDTVTQMSALCVGAGGAASSNSTTTGGAGGGGGALAWATFTTTPGETLYIRVGRGGSGSWNKGGDSGIWHGPDTAVGTDEARIILAYGGQGGPTSSGRAGGGAKAFGARCTTSGGGNGGNGGVRGTYGYYWGGGGGGAGGYSGNGGEGGGVDGHYGDAGTGGAAGGGAAQIGRPNNGGGGVGVYGEGASGGSVSGGNNGQAGSGGSTSFGYGAGGNYGGGGGAPGKGAYYSGGSGGKGFVWIIWGPSRFHFPNNPNGLLDLL